MLVLGIKGGLENGRVGCATDGIVIDTASHCNSSILKTAAATVILGLGGGGGG